LTPFFGALGIIFFYLWIKRLFNRRIGLVSALLLAVFPVYAYYSVRSMFHNVLFVVLGLIGFYFLTVALDRAYSYSQRPSFSQWRVPSKVLRGWLFIFISGLFFGAAIMTRSSELLWLGPILLLILLFYGRRIGLTRMVVFISGIILAMLPAFYYNQILYDSPFYGGYGQMNQSISTISQAGTDLVKQTLNVKAPVAVVPAASSTVAAVVPVPAYRQIFSRIFKTIFYFGFDTAQSRMAFSHYVTQMFPWLVWLSILGLACLTALNLPRPKKKYLVYVLSWLVLSVILVTYYGSWKFTDNPYIGHYTIGNSYTRYWLPLYLLGLPLVALALEFGAHLLLIIWRRCRYYQALVRGVVAVAVIIIASISVNYILFGSEEGLIELYYNTQSDKRLGQLVLSLTPPEAIVMTQYHDKVLFPERRIVMGRIAEEGYYPFINKLLDYYPVYYFNFAYTPQTEDYLNHGRLAKSGLHLDLIRKTGGGFALYRITKLEKDHE
jgi:4-amino-4-deoxy-L-arabinose transferase-like glycosyltransferase